MRSRSSLPPSGPPSPWRRGRSATSSRPSAAACGSVPPAPPAFFLKVLLVLLLLAILKAALGRLRIDQLVDWGWKVLTPAALIQIGVVLVLKAGGWLGRGGRARSPR